jgi:hypothetical protein
MKFECMNNKSCKYTLYAVATTAVGASLYYSWKYWSLLTKSKSKSENNSSSSNNNNNNPSESKAEE